MNVLVIPEDFRYDQFILKPLFEKMFKDILKCPATITVCNDPLIGGVREALKESRIREVVDRYQGMMKIFVLCVDRDGYTGRKVQLRHMEKVFHDESKHAFFAQCAWEELETWALAGLDLPDKWQWADVRKEIRVKEQYFDELAESCGLRGEPGGGRKTLGKKAARNIRGIQQKCSEDFADLAQRIREFLQSDGASSL